MKGAETNCILHSSDDESDLQIIADAEPNSKAPVAEGSSSTSLLSYM